MQRELEALQRAEETLSDLRKRLDEAELHKQTVLQEKSMLELKLKLRDRLKDQESTRTHPSVESDTGMMEECGRLQEEVERLQNMLHQTREQLEKLEFSQYLPADLQFWLQLTHEFEMENFNVKKRQAEAQFQQVKDCCEKIRKRRNAFFGSMRIAHGDILTTVDERIAEARKALEDVIADANERTMRWSHIQHLCAFEIVTNQGLQSLLTQERTRADRPPASSTQSSTPSVNAGDTSSFHPYAVNRNIQQVASANTRSSSNTNLSSFVSSSNYRTCANNYSYMNIEAIAQDFAI